MGIRRIVKIGAVFFASTLLFTGCRKNTERVHEVHETSQSTVVSTTTQETSDEAYQKLLLEKTELEWMNAALGAFGPVRLDREINAFILTPIDPPTVQGIANIMNGTQDYGSWVELVNAVKAANVDMNERLGGGYSTVIENPYQTGQMILAVKDGEVIHDGVAEQGGFTY